MCYKLCGQLSVCTLSPGREVTAWHSECLAQVSVAAEDSTLAGIRVKSSRRKTHSCLCHLLLAGAAASVA